MCKQPEKHKNLIFHPKIFQPHLCGKKLTHGVVGDKLADVVDALGCSQVLEHLEAVQGKLVVEQPVAEEHGEADAEDVAELAEAEPEVVLGVLGPEVKEVLGNLGGLLGGVALVALVAALHLHVLRLALQDVVDQPVLKKPLPGRPGNKKSNLAERAGVVCAHLGSLARIKQIVRRYGSQR